MSLNEETKKVDTMEKIIEVEDLKQKKAEGLGKVFSLSTEYLVANVAKEYCDINNSKFDTSTWNKISTVEDFNKKNNLNRYLITCYPFFVSLANGHSESLYNLFGSFYSYFYGPGSFAVHSLFTKNLKENNGALEFFKIGDENSPSPFATEIKYSDEISGNSDIYKSLELIQNKIKNQKISFDDKECDFKDVYIYSDSGGENPLYVAINSGINAIKLQSNKTFFDADTRSIEVQSMNFKSYRDAYLENRSALLDYQTIEKPRYRPFYSDKLIQ